MVTAVIKKQKKPKHCVKKRIFKFNDYKNCLQNNEIILKSQQISISEGVNVYTEEINKIALRSNYDKRLQTFYRITSYPYGANFWKSMQNRAAAVSKCN